MIHCNPKLIFIKKIIVCLLLALWLPLSATTSEALPQAYVQLILDCSGSMWGKIAKRPKIVIAKEVMRDLIRDLPSEVGVGLMAYGHRRKGDCLDIEQLVPLGPPDKKALLKKIKNLNAKGKTPMADSVRMSLDTVKGIKEPVTIILVSDGKETCLDDPCRLVRKLKASGVKFTMHVIGFAVGPDTQAQLECMAKAGGESIYWLKTRVS